jgi:hypothetical protein
MAETPMIITLETFSFVYSLTRIDYNANPRPATNEDLHRLLKFHGKYGRGNQLSRLRLNPSHPSVSGADLPDCHIFESD